MILFERQTLPKDSNNDPDTCMNTSTFIVLDEFGGPVRCRPGTRRAALSAAPLQFNQKIRNNARGAKRLEKKICLLGRAPLYWDAERRKTPDLGVGTQVCTLRTPVMRRLNSAYQDYKEVRLRSM